MNQKEDYYTFNEYMKTNTLTPSEEDYVEMIYRLTLENSEVKVKNISDKLNIKPPSVTKMIKKLDEKQILVYKKYDNINLTDLGKKVGRQLLKRHNIIRQFLEIIGIDKSIHKETEKMEHTVNLETLIKMEQLINFFYENDEILEKLRFYQKNIKS